MPSILTCASTHSTLTITVAVAVYYLTSLLINAIVPLRRTSVRHYINILIILQHALFFGKGWIFSSIKTVIFALLEHKIPPLVTNVFYTKKRNSGVGVPSFSYKLIHCVFTLLFKLIFLLSYRVCYIHIDCVPSYTTVQDYSSFTLNHSVPL